MKYALQILVMLVGPIFILIGIKLSTQSMEGCVLAIIANGLLIKDGGWDCWKPTVIKQFLKNAKKMGL